MFCFVSLLNFQFYASDIALQLASQGANLIIWDINPTSLAKIEKEISHIGIGKGSTVQTYVVDVSNEKQVQTAAVIL